MIVVEPALVAEQEQGLRELYVALTRPTKTLVVVHARELRCRASLRRVESGAVPELGHPEWRVRSTSFVSRIHRRIEAFATEHGVEAMVEIEL